MTKSEPYVRLNDSSFDDQFLKKVIIGRVTSCNHGYDFSLCSILLEMVTSCFKLLKHRFGPIVAALVQLDNQSVNHQELSINILQHEAS